MGLTTTATLFPNVPVDISLHILSYLGLRDLCNASTVSKGWHKLTNNSAIWVALAKRIYNQNIPSENAKIAFMSLYIPALEDISQLNNVVTTFVCKLGWNKKRELICTFPNTSVSNLVMKQSFGPSRGTFEGFKEKADEVIRYQYTGELPKIENNKHQFTSEMPYLTGFPITFFKDSPFPICTSTGGIYFTVGIDLDVGYGNSLGLFSAVNDWKEPFSLFCQSHHNSFEWVGRIPYGEFKFVKILSQGTIVWEKRYNRHWTPRSPGRPDSWDTYMAKNPIEFPD